jgi:hypothetical protein
LRKDPFENLPLTFHVESGVYDKEYSDFTAHFNRAKLANRDATAALQKKIIDLKTSYIRESIDK